MHDRLIVMMKTIPILGKQPKTSKYHQKNLLLSNYHGIIQSWNKNSRIYY